MSSLFELKKEITASPHVSFHFEGVIALGVRDNSNRFDAGIIKDPNNEGEVEKHIRSITVTKVLKQERTVLISMSGMRGDELVLDFKEINPGRINLFEGKKNPFDVINAFKWVIDVEKHMHNNNRVEVVDSALRTVLRVLNTPDTLFYADDVVTDPIPTEEENGSKLSNIDASAECIKALVPLRRTLFLKKKVSDGRFIDLCELNVEDDVRYEIVFKNSCNPIECEDEDIDVAPIYNYLIGKPSGASLRRIFKVKARLTPASQCAPINFGVSGELPDPAS